MNRDPSGRFWWKEFYTDWKGYDVSCACRDNGLILKAGEVLGGRAVALRAIKENQGNIDAASKQTGISQSTIKAIIYEEQSHQFPPIGLETTAENFKPGIVTGGIGVMQVSSQTSGLTNQELLDPRVNINAGAGILKDLQGQGYTSTQEQATRYNRYEGGPHAERYGNRVNSYANNQTYTSNMSRLVSNLNSAVGKLSKLLKKR